MNVVAKALSKARIAMSGKRSTDGIGPIGIDVALEEIHLVQLERSYGGRPRVRARASVAFEIPRQELIATPARFKSLIKQALSADAFHGRHAVLTVPSGLFRTISINYRSSGGPEQEAAAVAKIVAERLDGDVRDYIVDYLPVKTRSKSDDRLALVAVSQRGPVLEYLELFRRAGLRVRALEIGPVAITRLVGAISEQREPGNVLVVNSGRKASYLTLISGTDLLFDQEVRVGEDSLIAQIAESLDMPPAGARDLVIRTGVHPEDLSGPVGDAINASGAYYTLAEILKPEFLKLVEEINRAFLYAAAETRGGTVRQVYMLGSVARWPGSDQLLGRLAGVSVLKIPDPLALFPVADGTEPAAVRSAPEIAVATGLALRGLHGDE